MRYSECFHETFLAQRESAESLEATDIFHYQSYGGFAFEMESLNLQMSKSHVNTCKFQNRYFGSCIFQKFFIQNKSVASIWPGQYFEHKKVIEIDQKS